MWRNINKLARIPAMNFHLYFLYYWLRLFFFQWKLRIPSISEGPPTAAIRRSQSEYSSIVADTKFQRISFKIQTSQQSPVFHLYGHLCLKLRELNNCFNKSCMPHSETEIWKKLRLSNCLTDNWIPPSTWTDILMSLRQTHRLSSISNHSGN